MTHKRTHAFTLVELSIVLVIIGLLVGGVLAGQSLIRAAELRSIPTQYNQFMTAVNAFQDKYNALPGDMADATSYWGANTCFAGSAAVGDTCNGNGDGLIAAGGNSYEFFRFWDHLALGGFIEGRYTGIAPVIDGSFSSLSAVPENSPKGRINSSLWFVHDFDNFPSVSKFNGVYKNTFEFGKSIKFGDPAVRVLTPGETYNIDTKMDDGMPATGKLVIRMTGSPNCTDDSNPANMGAGYLLSNTEISCVLLFRKAF